MDWIKELGLTQAEHSIVSSGEKITATHVAATSKLLRGQFPDQNGLQDTNVLMHQQPYTLAPHDFIRLLLSLDSGISQAWLTGKPKRPLKVNIWGGVSKKGATWIVILTGTLTATQYTNILDAGLRPFLATNFPHSHCQ